jgi:hypothetical protein
VLLTDGCPNSVEDLRVYESAILDVAKAESIDLKVKLALATEEISEDVLDFLLDNGRANDPKAGTRRDAGVSDVVVTRQLKRWHAVHAISLVYRDALHNQLNARYEQQFADYRQLAQDARGQTLRFGVGVVSEPIPAADVPGVTGVAGSGAAAATYYIRVSWVDGAGREGAPSALTAFEAAAGVVPQVDPGSAPSIAVGFHVYVGLSADSQARQNGAAVPVGASFPVPAGLAGGPGVGNGQAADVYVTGARVVRRG